ncbi:hypothetical protein [Streptomyces agglomeratus]|uniref:hypothetical protein n=1 Tax=Streptomyces agglomeratus TaxID=285458 RepID=UPI00159F0CA9|nr:hypothetical protein [Streptomyces agglomeratus]
MRAQPRSYLKHVGSRRNARSLQQRVSRVRGPQEVLPEVSTSLETESGITVGHADDLVHRQGLLEH